MAALVAVPVCSAATPSRVGVNICPHVTQTSYPTAGQAGGPGAFGCKSPVSSPGSIFVNPDNTCTTPTNTDLGTFLTTDEPLGAYVGAGGLHNCATSPPTLGPGAPNAAVTLAVAQTGFCPTKLTLSAQTGPFGAVLFPIGNLPFGTYSVTVTFPQQASADPRGPQPFTWESSSATGTLHVGTAFTETDALALATTGGRSFATLLRNSAAGPGAGELVLTKHGNSAALRGTDYYGCGTINVAATVTLGKARAHGVARVTGNGRLTGGTGNYEGVKGAFTLTGRLSTKTNRGTFRLTGTARY